ncbi:MAG: T9SS type A sorting domain-containing protein [Calditrichia bacterium]
MKISFYLSFILSACLFFSSAGFAFTIQTDTLNVLALRVEFKPDSASTTTGDGTFDLSAAENEFQIDPPPHNRSYFQDHLQFLKNYYHAVSKGHLEIKSAVFPQDEDAAYRLDKPMTYYNPNTTPGQINTRLAELLRDALQKADADPAVNFADYQAFIIFHAGVGKDVELGYDETPQDIPSLYLTSKFLQENLGTPAILLENGTVQVENGMLIPETETQEGFELGLNGILVSNMGSHLGWPDLFSPTTRSSGVGRFGVMDAGLFNGDGLLPAVPTAWTRIFAGWEEPATIFYSPNEQLRIYPALSDNPQQVYRFPINSNEYFLVEHRYDGPKNLDSLRVELSQNRNDFPNVKEVLLTFFQDEVTFSERGVLTDLKNFDLGLPGSGVLIWHIDENIIQAQLAANRVNDNPEHRGIDLEEADGSQDIGQVFDFLSAGSGSETGWVLDMWYQGNSAPLFQEDGNRFGPNTVPNSRSYYYRANSHIVLSDFSRPDSVMTFRAKLDIYQQNFPRKIDFSVYGIPAALKVVNINRSGGMEMVLTTESGNILVIPQSGSLTQGTDSLRILQLGEDLIPYPAFFDQEDNSETAMVVLTRSGGVFGFGFKDGLLPDTLFPQKQLSTDITTPPSAYPFESGGYEVLWGAENGRVYQLIVENGNVRLDSTESIDQPVAFVHRQPELGSNAVPELYVIGTDGSAYRQMQLVSETYQIKNAPVGQTAAGVSAEGAFIQLAYPDKVFPEDGLFSFESPLTQVPNFTRIQSLNFAVQDPYFAAAGENKLFLFNSNFTLADNFPVEIDQPQHTSNLKFPVLSARFNDRVNNTGIGLVVSDPAGLIDGFDLQGKRLPDFPLAAGDSLALSPVLLDLDADGDMEIAAVTEKGMLYVWDLALPFDFPAWNQPLADEGNSGNLNTAGIILEPNPYTDLNSLMPEKTVYNWPNPNIDDFTMIRYYLTSPAEVDIRIYDLAGDLVEKLSAPGDANIHNEVRWNIGNIQSGVYLARIHAQSSQSEETRIIKIAVVK